MIIYKVNPAVTKSLLMKLNHDEFVAEALFIKEQVIQLEPGTNERYKFLRLYIWCRHYYKNKFKFPCRKSNKPIRQGLI